MNTTLSWPVFANVPIELRHKISAVYVFGKNGDKLLLFTSPTPPPPAIANNPTPTPSATKSSAVENKPPSSAPVVVVENKPAANAVGAIIAAAAGAEVVPVSGTIDENNNKEAAAAVIISDPTISTSSTEPEVFSTGKNTACCLATGDISLMVESCKRIDGLCGKKVVDVVASERLHVVALTDDGQVFAWGENRNGQVGNGAFDERVASPALIFEPDSFIQGQMVVQIAVGMQHSVCLTNSGKVYAWGTNDFGQIGDGTKTNKSTPVRVEGSIENSTIVQVACCQRSTLALDDKGHVYQWGNNWNDNGVGLGQPITRPQDVNALYPPFQNIRITRLACGANHVLALAESSAVYGWGRNDCGQLGLGFLGDGSKTREVSCAVMLPAKISDFSWLRVRIKAIMAHNQMNVSLAQSFSGVVYVWGRQSSSGSISSRPVPTTYKTIEAAFANSCHRPITAQLQKIDHDQFGTAVVGAPNWLRQMFDHRQSSDLEITVSGRPIYVHRTVLKMSSTHFRAMLSADHWKESKAPVIKIDKIPYTAYRAYLFYLYSDELILPADVTQEDVVSLLDLASSYLEEDLKLKAIDFFAGKWLDIDNAAAMYTLAVDHMLSELAAVCMEFIFENLTAVVTSHSFSQIDSNHAKTIFVRAANRRLFQI